jgi:hypothetical protein
MAWLENFLLHAAVLLFFLLFFLLLEPLSRLLCYFRQRVSISLQRSQARAVHHRAARAIERSVGLELQ